MYYNWRKIDGYNCPVRVVIGPRGIGKTFSKVYGVLRDFVDSKQRFVYVVETLDDVQTLSANKGERFFAGVKEYLSNSQSKRSKHYYNAIFNNQSSEIDSGETDLIGDNKTRIMGGTIKIQGETAGYLIPINAYGNLKRNNFSNIKTIIIDEFIPEEIDIRHLKIPRKIVSVVQTVARKHNIIIYMLGNSIRMDDILLVKMGLSNMRSGEFRVIKDKYGALIVCHFVNKNEYYDFKKASEQSVAGRLATLLNEDNLDNNEFKQTISSDLLIGDNPKPSSLLFCLHGENDSIRINVTKDYEYYYVMNDYGKNVRKRFCFNQKYISGNIHLNPECKEVLLHKYSQNRIKFESSIIHLKFKEIMGLSIK